MSRKARAGFWLFLHAISSLFFVSCQWKIAYPQAREIPFSENLHGVKVPDPYRWMEKDDSKELRRWIEEENDLTESYLSSIPERGRIKERLRRLASLEKFGIPIERGGLYFYTFNDGTRDQDQICCSTSLEKKPRVVLDPLEFSANGLVSLSRWAVSPDGGRLAYCLSWRGSDWNEIRVRDVKTGKDFPERLKWVRFSIPQWDRTGRGFYYGRYPKPKKGAGSKEPLGAYALYYHECGTPQASDRLVYENRRGSDLWFAAQETEDGKYLVLMIARGTGAKNLLYYKDLSHGEDGFKPLIAELQAKVLFVGSMGSRFWLLTDLHAPKGRIVTVDIGSRGPGLWVDVVPEGRNTIESADLVDGKLAVKYLVHASNEVIFYDLVGKHPRKVHLPGIGLVSGFTGRNREKDIFYIYQSLTSPKSLFRFDVETARSKLLRKADIDFSFSQYETKRVFCKSRDGTRFPMFLAYKKGIDLNGKNRVVLYGYGGFNISMKPYFSATRLFWLEEGGIYAQACLRGGGEYGRAWHEAGMRGNKHKVFEDFVAAAEWLIEKKYTKPESLAIRGESNGGLLVGACMLRRPDLFGACLAGVGVMDMLRFHKFTVGRYWIDEYGTPDDPGDFKVLLSYSPYHNIRKGVNYPATFITTADHDDRVAPAHSFKFAARLQVAQGGLRPVLIQVETDAGHGSGKPTWKAIAEEADKYAFLLSVLGH